jgi:hypothetical protein
MTAAAKTVVGRHAFEYWGSSEPNWRFPFEDAFAVV